MRGLNLNKPSRLTSNGYFSMIGDDLITPTSSADLQESYFNARVQAEKKNPELKKKVKALLQDSGSGVYFDPSWNKKLALEELELAIQKCIKEIVLKTGDLLVIDNRKTIHGRKPFQARYDGTDRWVQRVLVRKELPPIDQRDGRIITTTFSGY